MFKRKKKLVLIVIILTGIILLFIPVFLFLRSVAIYQPFTINISGIPPQEAGAIKINGITPLNRIIPIQYDETANEWWSNNETFLKKVQLIIPDTTVPQIGQLDIRIRDSRFTLATKDMLPIYISGSNHEYYLPAHVNSEFSLSKMLPVIAQWPVSVLLFRILIIICVLLFSIVFILGLKKKDSFSQKTATLSSRIKSGIQKFISPTILVWLKIVGFSTAFACGLFYGYLLLKFTISFYITAVLFIIFSGIVLWIFIKIILKLLNISKNHSRKTIKWLYLFMIIWFAIETILKLSGTRSSYNEKLGLSYSSGYIVPSEMGKRSPHLWVHPKYEIMTPERKEFSYEIKCNTDGLRDDDHPIEKGENEYRIICLGNSFTEGIGTPQDSTWPKLLENKLKLQTDKKITVFNAGNSGSDPFFEYMLLEERLLKYEPDLVLVALGSSDIGFFRLRGGFERFGADGLHFRKQPQWEKLYAVSNIFRYINDRLLNNKNFMSPEEYNADTESALEAIHGCLNRMDSLAQEKNFNFATVFYDDGGNTYTPLISKLKQEETFPVMDLFYYNNAIEKLNKLDRKKYFWNIDGHFNSKGYDLFAKGVEWNLKYLGIIDSLNAE